ncbi:MAG: hypothetical protein AUK47_23790 [Deltaproteobacteria bacterium CG2_30_63_29]|nr:MAG: hypothetical protein AUK47_23790 [Deltaproteobacteria bacterium CG2_30_63_29]PJB47887.1 MAG: glutamine--fructose-6-phosphate aminotransferase [Deltaproteobacteria bacterium CG_4_9_14_3_um_filter_63_12]
MCGVIGLICGREREDLGRIASDLLKMLEYRGYDSTGAAIQGPGTDVCLVKGVGAPSVMVNELGIIDMGGQILCGQVRWATFGAVTPENSQPHEVTCKTHIYGAHNGNVTNCDDLQAWLRSEGHHVRSDNDGEMVVHTVEHTFAIELNSLEDSFDVARRRECMRSAIIAASAKLHGSFSAVIVDPVSRCLWAIKKGSSLYFGLTTGTADEAFVIASSDLSSVLKITRVVVPIEAGEFVEYDARGYQIYSIADRVLQGPEGERRYLAGQAIERAPVRSRLRAKDTALLPQFETFMDQEISAQEQTCRNVITLFEGGTEALKLLSPYFRDLSKESIGVRAPLGTEQARSEPAASPRAMDPIFDALETLRSQYEDGSIREHFHQLVAEPHFAHIVGSIPGAIKILLADGPPEIVADRLFSSEAGLFADLLHMSTSIDERVAVRILDALLEREEVDEFAATTDRFTRLCTDCQERGGSIFVVSCGTSYHAAQAASLFFNEIAGTELIPILPGDFRGQYAKSLRAGDLFIAVSQSGETKDLIDVINDVIATGLPIGRVAVVNNVNSTLAQEKSDLVIPLRCGTEIAVPATKSFMNQLAVFYCLAIRLAQRRLETLPADSARRESIASALQDRLERLDTLPALIRDTFERTDSNVESAAHMLYLTPSIHILATRLKAVAKEGALKIREVVLNHTEGFEGSEFKHGPNTILGFNTLFGPLEIDALLKKMGKVLDGICQRTTELEMDSTSLRRLIQAATDGVLSPTTKPFSLNQRESQVLAEVFDQQKLIDELYTDYPLIYITGPDERDVKLTVSQINTHKIRGTSTVVIAEDHPALKQAAFKAPADNAHYQAVYITLPRTNDTLMMVFSATVVLQRLALRMSSLKQQYLDLLGIPNHGVHPDVPKNVSKSITVD